MSVSITFLGAAGTVTGSKYLLTVDGKKILVDAGMFQGERTWREKNWHDPQFTPSELTCVLLTHAHIDHIGMLPRFHRLGLRCPIYCNQATRDLAKIILLDSAKLQEEEVIYRLESGRSRHHPPLPLYNVADAQAVLELLKVVPSLSFVPVAPNCEAKWSPMGHIIGASSIEFKGGGRTITFSGDIGRYGVPILKDPSPANLGDLLLIESTYGDREHSDADPSLVLGEIISETAKRRGIVLIPSFAVGRTQLILFYLRQLKVKGLIPDIPVIIDSPMAGDATSIYTHNPNDYDEESLQLLKSGKQPFVVPKMHFIRDRSESIKLNSISEPMVLISASGMLTGGRILHHLKHRLANPNNTVLFVGFQPPGSRGDWLKRGAPSIQVLGQEVPVKAEIREISGLSAHGDRSELLRWCSSCSGKPSKVAVVHGEPEAAQHFATRLHADFKWNAVVPNYLQSIDV